MTIREPSLVKRLFDLAVALPAAVVAFPVCLILLAAVRMETPGSPLLIQRRVGRLQRPFRMFKIRTMYRDTPVVASHEAGQARITPLGAVLRRFKLDELPQLLNILLGDMSFVGPRPCLPTQDLLVTERSRRSIFTVRPGITGPGQIAGLDMSTPIALSDVEAEYFSRATLRSDLAIIFATLSGSGRGDAARGGKVGT